MGENLSPAAGAWKADLEVRVRSFDTLVTNHHAVPGDSGAWIYNPNTLQLCGHVLAWGNKSKTAYIAPMQVLFEDIRRTLGADRICLPSIGGSEVEEDMHARAARSVPQEQIGALTEIRSTNLNRQLEASKEVELALQGIRLDEDAVGGKGSTARARVLIKKDVPNSFHMAENQMDGKRGPTHRSDSGAVR